MLGPAGPVRFRTPSGGAATRRNAIEDRQRFGGVSSRMDEHQSDCDRRERRRDCCGMRTRGGCRNRKLPASAETESSSECASGGKTSVYRNQAIARPAERYEEKGGVAGAWKGA